MRDLKNNLDPQSTLLPATATGDRTGEGVDLQGHDAALAVLHVGTFSTGSFTAKLQESDDNTTFSDVGTDDQIGAFTVVDATDEDDTVQKVGYIGSKRYLRGFIDAGASTDVLATSMVIIRGHSARKPV